MKKLVLTLLLGVTTLTAFAQVPSYVPTNGLVGYWPFNGNANDESGNGNNGSFTGLSCIGCNNVSAPPLVVTDRLNNTNSAFEFTNDFDLVNIPNSSSLQLTNTFTISFWANPNQGIYGQGPSYLNILQKWGGTSNGASYMVALDLSGKPILYTNNGTVNSSIVGVNSILKNNWTNVIFTFDNGLAKLFINGIFINSENNLVIPSIENSSIEIARNLNQFTNYAGDAFTGKLDDIGIWNRELNQEEITALYNGCTTATITPQSTTTICQNGSVVLNASTAAGNTYEWYKNGTIINGSTTSSYTANQSGSYTVKVINGVCNETSSATAVTVNPNPTVSLSLENLIHIKAAPVTLAGSPSGGTYNGVGVVGSTFSSTNAGLGKKTITYNYTTGAGCSGSATAITTVYDTTVCSTFDTLFINIAVAGLTAPNNLGTLKIWPNPANDHITIDNGNFSILNGYSVKIETVLGQEVFKSAINQQQFSVDLSTWKGKGIYLVHILDGQNNIIETKKIILQ